MIEATSISIDALMAATGLSCAGARSRLQKYNQGRIDKTALLAPVNMSCRNKKPPLSAGGHTVESLMAAVPGLSPFGAASRLNRCKAGILPVELLTESMDEASRRTKEKARLTLFPWSKTRVANGKLKVNVDIQEAASCE